mgnify:CR=1 FL=1
MADMRTELLRTLRRRGTGRLTGGLWALWLVLCLLLAQHAGLVHRIQHGGAPVGLMSTGLMSAGLMSSGLMSAGLTLAGQASPTAAATATAARDDASASASASASATATDADADADIDTGTGTDRHAPDSARASTHSCVLFDAATQAPGACGAPPMPLLSHGKPLVPPGITWRWPHLPPQRSFLTRAPPASLAFA